MAGEPLILVDPLSPGRVYGQRARSWCHMVSDTSLEELHEMAGKLGMPIQWFQGDHYDLAAARRARAVALGAVEVSGKDLVRRMCYRKGRKRALPTVAG